MHSALPIVLDFVSSFLLVVGAAFAVIGGIGIIRLPEFFSRMHGSGITDTLGAGMILLGLLFQSGSLLLAFKLIVILFFMIVTSPSSCHALAHSAIVHGLKPVLDVPTVGARSDHESSDSDVT